ncbi:hypothetical protein B0H14DRAFT_2585530 [Mycena olivaceomarginata]|nr:hypothetical protein B0H14DRAFT_2585530 [Mycena olivaceomarginata]
MYRHAPEDPSSRGVKACHNYIDRVSWTTFLVRHIIKGLAYLHLAVELSWSTFAVLGADGRKSYDILLADQDHRHVKVLIDSNNYLFSTQRDPTSQELITPIEPPMRVCAGETCRRDTIHSRIVCDQSSVKTPCQTAPQTVSKSSKGARAVEGAVKADARRKKVTKLSGKSRGPTACETAPTYPLTVRTARLRRGELRVGVLDECIAQSLAGTSLAPGARAAGRRRQLHRSGETGVSGIASKSGLSAGASARTLRSECLHFVAEVHANGWALHRGPDVPAHECLALELLFASKSSTGGLDSKLSQSPKRFWIVQSSGFHKGARPNSFPLPYTTRSTVPNRGAVELRRCECPPPCSTVYVPTAQTGAGGQGYCPPRSASVLRLDGVSPNFGSSVLGAGSCAAAIGDALTPSDLDAAAAESEAVAMEAEETVVGDGRARVNHKGGPSLQQVSLPWRWRSWIQIPQESTEAMESREVEAIKVVRKIALTSAESNKAVTMEKTEGREKGNGPTREGARDVQSSGASLLATGFKRKTSAAPQLPSLRHLPVQALARRAMLIECALSRMLMSATLKKQEKPGMRCAAAVRKRKAVRLLRFDQPHIDSDRELGTRVLRSHRFEVSVPVADFPVSPRYEGKEQATAPRQKSSIPLGKIEEVSKLGNYIDKDLSKIGAQREAATRKDDVCREENMLVYSDQIQSIVVWGITELDPRRSSQEGTTFRICPLCKARGALTTRKTLDYQEPDIRAPVR